MTTLSKMLSGKVLRPNVFFDIFDHGSEQEVKQLIKDKQEAKQRSKNPSRLPARVQACDQ